MPRDNERPNLIWLDELELEPEVHIPRSWELTLSRLPQGVIMILGSSDSGKSTFAKYLLRELFADEDCLGYLDCDVGQGTLGLPTTLNLAVVPSQEGEDWRFFTYFVGHISPRGHMLPMVVGTHKLQRRAEALGVSTIIVDTTGLVDSTAGGVALKNSIIELLEPTALVGLRQGSELEPILRPWRHRQRLQVFELPAVPQAVIKPREARIRHRHRRWLRYFDRAESLKLSLRLLPHIAIFGLGRASRGQLLAFQDEEGLTLGLGIIQIYDHSRQELVIRTPLAGLKEVCSLRIGDVRFYLGEGEIREWLYRENQALFEKA
ncbi:MAG: polynucleotide 5'-hydroxyl-kinase [Chloroflexota bacterium]|nr:polynucleotide 5'-hydroxyl-kinase [Chloroflexota bacterium]